jgi:hypothetical protein
MMMDRDLTGIDVPFPSSEVFGTMSGSVVEAGINPSFRTASVGTLVLAEALGVKGLEFAWEDFSNEMTPGEQQVTKTKSRPIRSKIRTNSFTPYI